MIKNYPVQGFATADIVPIVMLEIETRLNGYKSMLVNSVHDSVVLDVHPLEERDVLNIIDSVNSNLKNIVEMTDETALQDQAACAGGACEIV